MTSMTTPTPISGGALNKKYAFNFNFSPTFLGFYSTIDTTIGTAGTDTPYKMHCNYISTHTWSYSMPNAWVSKTSTMGTYKYCTCNWTIATAANGPQVGQCLKSGSYIFYVAQYSYTGDVDTATSGKLTFITTHPSPSKFLVGGSWTGTTASSYYPSDFLVFKFSPSAHFTNIKTVFAGYNHTMAGSMVDIQGGLVTTGKTANKIIAQASSASVSAGSTQLIVNPTTYATVITGNTTSATALLLQTDTIFPLILIYSTFQAATPIIINGDVTVMSADSTGAGGTLTNVCLLNMYSILHYNNVEDAYNPFIISYTY
jgi:hypothetical protein